MSIIDAVSQI